VARRDVGIKARLRHRAGDRRPDLRRIGANRRDRAARRLDPEVDGRHLREGATIVDERRPLAVEQQRVLELRDHRRHADLGQMMTCGGGGSA
jgi:hypothetical protein